MMREIVDRNNIACPSREGPNIELLQCKAAIAWDGQCYKDIFGIRFP